MICAANVVEETTQNTGMSLVCIDDAKEPFGNAGKQMAQLATIWLL
jgi:hypothetical protein